MNWGWHWKIDNKGKAHRVGVWLAGRLYNYKIYIPFINQLWLQ